MDKITVDVGVYTSLEVDLSQFDFTGISKVVMTAKNDTDGQVIFVREFYTAQVHPVEITPEESNMLEDGAEYDFDIITEDGRRFKNGPNGRVALRRGVGNAND